MKILNDTASTPLLRDRSINNKNKNEYYPKYFMGFVFLAIICIAGFVYLYFDHQHNSNNSYFNRIKVYYQPPPPPPPPPPLEVFRMQSLKTCLLDADIKNVNTINIKKMFDDTHTDNDNETYKLTETFHIYSNFNEDSEYLINYFEQRPFYQHDSNNNTKYMWISDMIENERISVIINNILYSINNKFNYLLNNCVSDTLVLFKSNIGQSQDWHSDNYYLKWIKYTALIYLNTIDLDFNGGELEIMNEENDRIIIQPEVGKTILFKANEHHLHKVHSVTNGQRYFLRIWYTELPQCSLHFI
jgi:hypothetical protein